MCRIMKKPGQPYIRQVALLTIARFAGIAKCGDVNRGNPSIDEIPLAVMSLRRWWLLTRTSRTTTIRTRKNGRGKAQSCVCRSAQKLNSDADVQDIAIC